MFEQLMDLVKQNSNEAIVNNPDVPNEQNEAVTSTATSSIMDSLKGMLSGNGASSVMNLFHGDNSGKDLTDHPVTQNVSSDLVSNLMSKFGFSSDKASGIAGSLVPMIINKLVHKTNDPNDSSFDISSIFSSLSGGKTGGMDIGGMISKFGGSGLDKNHDGKVDLSDLTAAFSGGGATSGSQEGGGMMDKIKGLFGG